MQKLSTAPFSEAKKSGTKREGSPCTPYKRKARGKENKTGFYSEPYKTARAHTREQRLRYDAAGEGAQEILSLFGTTTAAPTSSTSCSYAGKKVSSRDK